MRARVGDEPVPSMALLDRHVRYVDLELNLRYRQTTSFAERRDVALAGLANLFLWLGWIRSGECFELAWADVTCLEPADGPQLDLPVGCGLVQLRLAPETKSDRGKRADVLLAYLTASGLCVGLWYHRARASCLHPDGPLFCHLTGGRWTSHYFRHTFLYPSLHRQRLAGDKMLAPFDGSSGNKLEGKFWSLHCYRRGSRSHVSRNGRFGAHRFRKATKDQVYEHARWSRSRSSEDIDVIYREWTPFDRVKITLYSH